jgi:hypothetical protein
METKRRRWTTDRLTDDAIPTTASKRRDDDVDVDRRPPNKIFERE